MSLSFANPNLFENSQQRKSVQVRIVLYSRSPKFQNIMKKLEIVSTQLGLNKQFVEEERQTEGLDMDRGFHHVSQFPISKRKQCVYSTPCSFWEPWHSHAGSFNISRSSSYLE